MATETLQQQKEKPKKAVYYPTEDGEPMAETRKHREQMVYAIESLRPRYADQPDVYIAGNNFIYYVEGDPQKRISPDCYVVFGVDKNLPDPVKIWELGGLAPDVIFEITSPSTKKEDTGKKFRLYEQVLGTQEYFLFDPNSEYLTPNLQGWRLVNRQYVRIAETNGTLWSAVLELEIGQQDGEIRFHDPASDYTYLAPQELWLQNREMVQDRQELLQHNQELTQDRQELLLQNRELVRSSQTVAQRNQELEAEMARLKAELERLRTGASE